MLSRLGRENMPKSRSKYPKNASHTIKNKTQAIASPNVHAIQREESYFSGPIPDPDTLIKYEQTLPGAADRILTMAENQSRHRQGMEAQYMNVSSRNSLIGVVFAGVIGIIGITGGIYLFIKDKSWPAYTVFFTTLGTIVGSFLKGTHDSNKQLKEKVDD